MSKKIVVGVVGAGMWGMEHVKEYVKRDNAKVKWLIDMRQDLLDQAKSKYPIENTGTDVNAMLSDNEVNFVVIATPPWTHFSIGMAAVKTGKDVLIEKPICTTAADAEKLAAEARKNPGQLLLGGSSRHSRINPKFVAAKKLVDDGKLGKVYYIHHRAIARQSRAGIEYNPTAKWFLDRKKAGGGLLYDWGVYDLSFHLGLIGDPSYEACLTSFLANGMDQVDPGTPVFDVEEHGAVTMRFAGNLNYYWERASNAHSDHPNQTTIYGTKGGLRLSYCSWENPDIEYFYVDSDGKGKPQVEVIKADMSKHPNDMIVFIDRLLECLTARKQLPTPFDREVINLGIIEKVYSAATWLNTRQ